MLELLPLNDVQEQVSQAHRIEQPIIILFLTKGRVKPFEVCEILFEICERLER